MAYHRPEYLPINYSPSALVYTGTPKPSIRQACGGTTHDQSPSPWSWTTSESNTWAKNMPPTYSTLSKNTTKLQPIGKALCTAGSNLTGIMQSAQLTYPCQDMSSPHCINFSTQHPNNHATHHRPGKAPPMAPKYNSRTPSTAHRPCQRHKSPSSSKSWARSYSTLEP